MPKDLIQVSITSSPILTFVTPFPTASTIPDPSWPKAWGNQRSFPLAPAISKSWVLQIPLNIILRQGDKEKVIG